MNMKRLLTLFFAFTFAFLIISCATFQPNQKRLVGTWKAVSVEKYNIPNLKTATQNTPQVVPDRKTGTNTGTNTTTATTIVVDTNASSQVPEKSRAEKVLARMIENEKTSTLTINADKTALKESPGKTVHATWKLKKKGTQLLIATKETGKKMTVEIQKITDTSAVVLETLPIGGLKVTYHKVKK